MIVCPLSPADQARLEDFLRLVKPISVGIQAVGLLFWGFAWSLADSDYRYVSWQLVLIACSVALSIAACCLTSWQSFFSITTMWLQSLGFSMLMAESPDRPIWAMSISVIFSLVGAPLFPRLSVSAMASVGTWLIIGQGEWIGTPHGLDAGWTCLMPCAAITLGLLMQIIFTKLHREGLSLRQELEQLAYKDVLTGTSNRRKLLGDIQSLHEQGKLDDGCFLMVDVDDFKRINDDFGHATGDIVLQRIGAVLRDIAGENAFGRLGGEEFGIMLTGGGLEHAQLVAARILAQVQAIRIKDRTITVSVGISGLGEQRVPSELIREADVALYEAKRLGKDRFVLHGGN